MARKFPNRRPSASMWRREGALQDKAEDRRDCYWLYVVTCCKRPEGPKLMRITDPAQLQWNEIQKIDHYAISVRALSSCG